MDLLSKCTSLFFPVSEYSLPALTSSYPAPPSQRGFSPLTWTESFRGPETLNWRGKHKSWKNIPCSHCVWPDGFDLSTGLCPWRCPSPCAPRKGSPRRWLSRGVWEEPGLIWLGLVKTSPLGMWKKLGISKFGKWKNTWKNVVELFAPKSGPVVSFLLGTTGICDTSPSTYEIKLLVLQQNFCQRLLLIEYWFLFFHSSLFCSIFFFFNS